MNTGIERKIKDITIVSLSKGILGETFIRHELEIGVRRLKNYGIRVHFSEHALMGLDYIEKHPESRAQDLLDALLGNTDMILCAIGGDDTYRLLPFLFGHDELKTAVRQSPNEKIFLGFSDSTINHLMLHKTGLNTFYGQAFLPDICELGREMLPYSRHYLEELITTGTISKITPSDVWYDSREDFSPEAVGTALPSHENNGFVLLQGQDGFEGKILGGCIDTIFDIFSSERYADSPGLCAKYGLFPDLNDWRGKILLLESSEEKAAPEKYRAMLETLKKTGIFGVISGILIGKPADETYFDAYKKILKEVIDDPALPIAVNINIGHAAPRCIIPFGVTAKVNVAGQEILFEPEKPAVKKTQGQFSGTERQSSRIWSY